MRVRKGQSTLRIKRMDQFYGAYWDDLSGSGLKFCLSVVSRITMGHLKDTDVKSTAEIPVYVCATPTGVEFYPAACKAGNIIIRYGTVHEV